MKKNTVFTKLILLLLLILTVKLAGCEQEDMDFYIDCDYCMDEIPAYDTLWVSLTINDENPHVPLKFYIGNYDDGTEAWTDTAVTETYSHVCEVGVTYTVKAQYQSDDQIVIAIDGDKIKVIDGEGDCYSPCYYLRGGTLDVRLAE